MNKIALIAWLTACAVSIWFAFHIKYKVQELEAELGIAQIGIESDREAIRVLEAEWSFLNQPSHLADLAERYLDFKPMLATQVVHLSDIPPRGSDDADSLDSIIEELLRNAPDNPARDTKKSNGGAALMRTGATQ
jgi:hypothetical protein